MARSAAALAGKSMPRTRALKPRERKPYLIGEFTVEGPPIGKGGYAFVHRVVSKRGAAYAVKELRHAMREQRDAVRRFHREFEVTSSLEHPNIVRMHECFEANGTWNIRMELVNGASLDALARSGDPFPVEVVAALALPILSALEFAHQHGAVHRDVKPGNILVSSAGVPKLTDFGIARVEDVQVTRDGLLLGTPSYMSPEQLAGKRGQEIDGRSDLYSLGVVLYELASGRNPHGIRPRADIYEVIRIKHEQDPKPLSVEGAEQLEAVLRTALARDPSQRFADANQMASALKSLATSKRALRDELARRIDAVPAPSRRKAKARRVAPSPPSAVLEGWMSWRSAGVAAALVAVLLAGAGWALLRPGGIPRLERELQGAFDHYVSPSLERARGAGTRP